MTLSSSRTLAFAALPSFPVNEFPGRASREVGGAGHPVPHRPPRRPLGPVLSFAASPGSPPVSLRSTRSPRTARGPCGQASPRPRPRPPRPPRAAPRPRQPAAGRGLRRRAGLPPRVRAPTSVLAAPPPAAASPLKRRATHRPGFPQRGVWAAFAALEEPRPECAPPNRPATRRRLGPAHRPRPPGRACFPPPSPPRKGTLRGARRAAMAAAGAVHCFV